MIIWGSSRQARKGGSVVDWVNKQAEADTRFEVDFVDLQKLSLPFFDEPLSPFSMARQGVDYTHAEGKAWAERVGRAQAIIIVTPEYNHGVAAVLKNALDWVGPEWTDKPVGLISYGGISGGARAVEGLRTVTTELGLIQVANGLHFPYFEEAFDEHGQPKRLDYYEANIKKMFDELVRLQKAFS